MTAREVIAGWFELAGRGALGVNADDAVEDLVAALEAEGYRIVRPVKRQSVATTAVKTQWLCVHKEKS